MARGLVAGVPEHAAASTSPMSRVRNVFGRGYGLIYDVVSGDGVRELDTRDVQSYFRTADGWFEDIGIVVRDNYSTAGLSRRRVSVIARSPTFATTEPLAQWSISASTPGVHRAAPAMPAGGAQPRDGADPPGHSARWTTC